MDCSPPGFSVHGVFQARILEYSYHFLIQGVFLTQELNPGLWSCRQILYQLSYGKPIGTIITFVYRQGLSHKYTHNLLEIT